MTKTSSQNSTGSITNNYRCNKAEQSNCSFKQDKVDNMNVCENNDTFCNIDTQSSIELEPFIHQVGGRSAILSLGDCICKPINNRELTFYETLDQFAPELKPFVPKYNGIISVNFEESNDGYLVITAKPSSLKDSANNNSTNDSTIQNSTSRTLHSPYQKFVTKYRIKLCRPLREIIIESHEQDVENNVTYDLESSKKQLESLIQSEDGKNFEGYRGTANSLLRANSVSNSQISTNLCRSRSTSISIPNFEDGNVLFQTELSKLFSNETNSSFRNKSTSPKLNRQCSLNASPSINNKIIYNNTSTTKHNPWVLKTFSSLSEFNESMKEQKFLLLENLVSNYQYPCIMDLKMGTRLHDDNATQTKIQSHESKVNETTSGALGLRITGIQIYDKSLDRFICYNKYYGRKLTPESFRSTLKMFVSNESFAKHNLMDKLIEKLRKLRSVIVQLETFRFYTSSLLLIYEGNTCQYNRNNNNEDNSSDDLVDCDACTSNFDLDKLLDIRVIDFAHSTHGQINQSISPSSSYSNIQSGNSPISEGYDEGFVYGLDNLIKILTLFKSET